MEDTPMKPTVHQVEVTKWLPTAKAVRVHERRSKGFRFVIETGDYRISGNHPRMAEAWFDAWKRVVGADRCENCGVPIHIIKTCCEMNTVWVHADNRRVCWWQPEDGLATPADADSLAKMANEDCA
jgi:hypothetical protein